MRTFKNSRFTVSIMAILFAISFSNCSIQTGHGRSTYKAKKLPPGQAKKIFGGKSAKRYAPGQNK
jgi:hypothetical protein